MKNEVANHFSLFTNHLDASNFTSVSEISFPPRIIKRSTTFRNSRIFPVQSYSCNNLIACFENDLLAFPCSSAIFVVKCSINNGFHKISHNGKGLREVRDN